MTPEEFELKLSDLINDGEKGGLSLDEIRSALELQLYQLAEREKPVEGEDE